MKKAMTPEEVTPLFLEFFYAGDIEGILSLFEEDGVLVPSVGAPAISGQENIRQFYEGMLGQNIKFENIEHRPVMISGDIALTSTKIAGGPTTAEVVRRQPDGSWCWVIDTPAFAFEK